MDDEGEANWISSSWIECRLKAADEEGLALDDEDANTPSIFDEAEVSQTEKLSCIVSGDLPFFQRFLVLEQRSSCDSECERFGFDLILKNLCKKIFYTRCVKHTTNVLTYTWRRG